MSAAAFCPGLLRLRYSLSPSLLEQNGARITIYQSHLFSSLMWVTVSRCCNGPSMFLHENALHHRGVSYDMKSKFDQREKDIFWTLM